MSQLVTLDNSEIPGKHLVEGQDMINLAAAVNGLGAGTIPFTGNVVTSGFLDQSTANALTAAGTNQATALQLTAAVNNVTTSASNTGVALPLASTVGIGGAVLIFNDGANPIKVYGNAAGTDTIDGTAGATGVTLTNAKRCLYYVVAAGTFISAQLGVVSA